MRRASIAVSVMVLAACSTDRNGEQFGESWMQLPTFDEFEAADTDHSGKLTREEAKALPTVLYFFDAMDTDRNGLVSWAEAKNLDLSARRRQKPIPP